MRNGDKTMAKIRRAFTLVELMMVILIIGIVMALLMKAGPDLVRNIKVTQTERLLMTLEIGCQRYKQVFGTYPPCGAERQMFSPYGRIDSFKKNFKPCDQESSEYYLYLALQGPEGFGWSVDDHEVSADFGPFLEGGSINTGQREIGNTGYFGPVLLDAFNSPILYLKAQMSPKVFSDHLDAGNSRAPRYDCWCLRAIFGGQSGIGGWQAGGMWNYYAAHWKLKMTAQYAEDSEGKMRYYPHNPDSFVLWSAGPDEKFGYWIYDEENNGYDFIRSTSESQLRKGTCDDITNF